MQPNIQLNWPAVLVALIASMALGFAWFGPLFGKLWAKEMGFPADFKPPKALFVKAMILQTIGAFLVAYVMAWTVALWRPSVWNAGTDQSSFVYGMCGAVFTWIGFYVPQRFGIVGWEGKSWKLFGIYAGGDFLTLFVVAQILANWR